MAVFDLLSLPEGQVTLLFFHLRGATVLWETRPAQFRPIYERCERALVSGLAEHEGRLVKVMGDALYFAAFADARAALTCVGKTLTRLYHDIWPADFSEYGPRAALYTGAPVCRTGDYFGPPVNRCARMVEIAVPWQTLLNAGAVGEIGEKVPPEVHLIARGSHTLRDVAEPIPLYEARLSCLPIQSEATALTASPLPEVLTDYFGCEEVKAFLRALLADPQARLITLTGPGGCGKTRLALEILREPGCRLPGPIRFLSLAEFPTEKGLLRALASAFGSALPEGAEPQTLPAGLQEQQGLLILDGFEPFAGESALLSVLLSAAPGLRCLVTSRLRLGRLEEHVLSIPPLPVEEAVSLLADRALAIRPEFPLTPDNLALFREVAYLLDGLPLALELAAPLLRGLTPTQLLSRLRGRRLDLAPSPRDCDPRHKDLRRCFDASCRLLSAWERRLLARLSVFVGPFPQTAVEVVCSDDPITVPGDPERALSPDRVCSGLRRLCDHSLLVPIEGENQPYYRLTGLIREYMLEKRDDEETDPAMLRTCHARVFMQRIREAWARYSLYGGGAYYHLCALELENLRAGMAWAQESGENRLFTEYFLSLADYLIEKTDGSEYRLLAPVAERTLEALGETRALARLYRSNAHLARCSGDLVAAARQLARIQELLRRESVLRPG